MNQSSYPYIALAIALLISIVLYGGQVAGIKMPLLAVMMLSEFGFLVAASGTIVAIKHQIENGINTKYILLALACLPLAIYLGMTGYMLWVAINS